MEKGHIQQIAQWTKQYGDVIRVSLGERETVRSPYRVAIWQQDIGIDATLGQVFINSHNAFAQTVVQQGPAFQSRPTFKLYHSDYASSGIWTVGSKSRWMLAGLIIRLTHGLAQPRPSATALPALARHFLHIFPLASCPYTFPLSTPS